MTPRLKSDSVNEAFCCFLANRASWSLEFFSQKKRRPKPPQGFTPISIVSCIRRVLKNFCVHFRIGLRVVTAALHSVLVDKRFKLAEKLSTELHIGCPQIV